MKLELRKVEFIFVWILDSVFVSDRVVWNRCTLPRSSGKWLRIRCSCCVDWNNKKVSVLSHIQSNANKHIILICFFCFRRYLIDSAGITDLFGTWAAFSHRRKTYRLVFLDINFMANFMKECFWNNSLDTNTIPFNILLFSYCYLFVIVAPFKPCFVI